MKWLLYREKVKQKLELYHALVVDYIYITIWHTVLTVCAHSNQFIRTITKFQGTLLLKQY